MRILVYGDIHGNKYALEELQKLDDYKMSDLRIFLGDVFAMCPYSKECLEKLLESKDILLMGNHDSYGAFGLPIEEFAYFSERKIAHQKYMRDKLGEKLQNELAKFPKDYHLKVGNVKLYFTHYLWESDKLIADDPDEPAAPTEKTAKLFSNINAEYILFAHNHKPADFTSDDKRFICIGSLGMKKIGNYVVVEIENDRVAIKHKKLNYDLDRLLKEMQTENYPSAESYIKWFNEE